MPPIFITALFYLFFAVIPEGFYPGSVVIVVVIPDEFAARRVFRIYFLGFLLLLFCCLF